MTVPFIKTNNSITILVPGMNPRTVLAGTAAYDMTLKLIKENESDVNKFIATIDPLLNIRQHTSGLFEVTEDGQVFIAGEKLPASIGNRLFDFADNGMLDQAKVLVKFWDNCKANPDPRARTDLYAFLEHNGIPLTDDGCFIAYRYVKRNGDGDLVDYRTGTMINNVGCIVSMPRENCDANPTVTCSTGLHVAAFGYAVSSGNVIVNVKVNPKNVVAIPTDYNGQKMRVCEFEVIAINSETAGDAKLIKEPLVKVSKEDEYLDSVEDDDDVEDDIIEQYMDDDGTDFDDVTPAAPAPVKTTVAYQNPRRDKNGRFISKIVPKRDANGRFSKK